jgi:hypothetical protein
MLQVEVARPALRVSATDGHRPKVRAPHLGSPNRSGIPDALLVAATSVLLVAIAYARAREQMGGATPLFWIGQVLLFSFITFRVVRPSTPTLDREFLVILYAGAQSVIRWAYSPQMFTFTDELQHYRSLVNMLTTNQLFQTNYSLPISPRYPGMENVTAELAQVSAAGPFASGVVIAGASHVLLAACILLFLHTVSGSSRIACIGVLLYLLNPHAQYFDTSFHYETVALPFVVLTLFFAVRFATRQDSRYESFAGVLASVAIVIMTHHVSAFAALGLLTAIGLAVLVFRDTRRLALPLAACVTAGALIVAAWIHFVAPVTIDYLGSPGAQVLDGLARIGQFDGKVDLPAPPTPTFDRIFGPAGVLLTLILLVFAVRFAHRCPPLQRSVIWLAFWSYGLVIAIRLFVSNGAELSARMLTFTALFTALATATVLGQLSSPMTGRHHRLPQSRTKFLMPTALAVTLFLGSIPTSLPEWWQRLPGQFLVGGFASGIDSVGISRAEWAATYLTPGSRYFGDVTSWTLLATLAQLDPIRNPDSLYYTDRLNLEHYELINAQSATYLDVDLRMAEQAPITGRYFAHDIHEGTDRKPMDIDGLAKFENIPGVSRIYDSGFARFYDLRWIQEPHHAK